LPDIQWEYYFVISSGESFSTTDPSSIYLFNPDEFNYPHFDTGSNFWINPVLHFSWDIPYLAPLENFWWTIQFSQNRKIFSTHGQIFLPDIGGLKTGNAQVTMSGYSLATPSSLDRNPANITIWSGSIILDRTHEVSGKEKVSLRNLKNAIVFKFRTKQNDKIRSSYYLTLPNWDVQEYTFPKKFIDEQTGLLRTGITINGSIPTLTQGAYKFEVVQNDGFAYFNIPVFQGQVWSIIPLFSYNTITTIKNDGVVVRKDVLNAINKIRSSLGRDALPIDPILEKLAQAKAENMAQYDYVWHWTKEWDDIVQFGTKLWIPLSWTIAENVAWGNVSHFALQDWLEESWSHRHSMVDPLWKKYE